MGSSLATALNVAPQQVYQWASGSRTIPLEHCVATERATKGLVSRKDLRPDDWQKIWPELADQAGPTPSESKTIQEMRRETDLGYRQPANSKQVGS